MPRKTTNNNRLVPARPLAVLLLGVTAKIVFQHPGVAANIPSYDCPAESAACIDDPVCYACITVFHTGDTGDAYYDCYRAFGGSEVLLEGGQCLVPDVCCTDEIYPDYGCSGNSAYYGLWLCSFNSLAEIAGACSSIVCEDISGGGGGGGIAEITPSPTTSGETPSPTTSAGTTPSPTTSGETRSPTSAAPTPGTRGKEGTRGSRFGHRGVRSRGVRS